MTACDLAVKVAAARRCIGVRELGLLDRLRLIRTRVGQGRDALVKVGDFEVWVSAAEFDNDLSVLIEVLGDEYAAVPFRGATVLDVGAHKGYFAVYALAHGAAHVTCYEPAPTNFAYLSRTCLDARPAAVAATAGNVRLALDEGWTHSIVLERHPDAETIDVPAVTLSQAIAEHSPSLVKLDIEGAEREVLAATAGQDWDGVHLLVVEVHPWACSPDEIAAVMRKRGFNELDRGDPTHPLMRFAPESL
jgi:FkbM family methyltransferase